MEFKHDEAVAWLRATALVRGIEFSSTGLVSSKGLENFPLFLYLLAGFRILLFHPPMLIWPIALLNSIAVFFIFHGTRLLLSGRVAWLATLLYVVSPCAVFFSRKIWAQDLLPFWSSAMFGLAAILLAQPSRQKSALFLTAFSFLALTSWQIHFSAAFLFVAYGVIIVLNLAIFKPRPCLLGAAAALIPARPYFLFQFNNHFNGIAALYAQSHSFAHFRVKELLFYFARQVTDEGFHVMLGPDYPAFLGTLPGYALLRYGLGLLVLAGLALCFSRAIHGVAEDRKRCGVILVLTLLPLILLGASRIPLTPSYFIIFYPLPFVLAALPLAETWSWMSKRFSPSIVFTASVALVLALVGAQCRYSFAFLHRLKKDGGTRGDYGVTYQAQLDTFRSQSADGRTPSLEAVKELSALAIIVANRLDPPKAATTWTNDCFTPRFKLVEPELTPLQKAEDEHARLLAQRLLKVD